MMIQYKNNMGSFRAIWYDMIQWLEITIAWYTELHDHSVQGLYSVCVERKHKPLILGSAGASLPWSTIIWNDATDAIRQNVRVLTKVKFTIHPCKCEKYIHIAMFDMLDTRCKL